MGGKVMTAVLVGVVVAAIFLVSASAGVSFVAAWGSSGTGAGHLSSPWGVATGPSGAVYVAEESNNRISEFTAAGSFVKAWGWGVSDGASSFETCTTSCGQGLSGGGGGEFNTPSGVATDNAGNLYVSDYFNARIEEFSSSGAFIKVFGKGVDQTTGADVCTAASGDTCQAGSHGGAEGELNAPRGVAVDGSGNVYVADVLNDRVAVFSSSSGAFIKAFGSLGSAAGQLASPAGIASYGGNVYIADPGNHRIDEFSSAGAFTKAWGWGVRDGASSFETCTSSCQAGSPGSEAGQMYNPAGVATDSAGNVYVADYNNARVDEFSSSGTFVKAWGWGVSDGASSFESCRSSCQAGIPGSGLGQFDPFGGVATARGSSSVIYVADRSNDRVERFSTTYRLTVRRLGRGSGKVKSSPAGIHCGAICAHAYGDGTVVTLTAKPSITSRFAGWTGACTGRRDCTVTMNQARTVRATFKIRRRRVH
jgi:hypothetical protein